MLPPYKRPCSLPGDRLLLLLGLVAGRGCLMTGQRATAVPAQVLAIPWQQGFSGGPLGGPVAELTGWLVPTIRRVVDTNPQTRETVLLDLKK